MHKAWNNKDVPYRFSRSYVKLLGHTALKLVEFDQDWAFPDDNSSLNSPMVMKWCTKLGSCIEEVPYCFSRSYVKLQGHTVNKIVDFEPNWAFPDSNSSLNSLMAWKWCTKLGTVKKMCPIVFLRSSIKCQGYMGKEFDDLTPILSKIIVPVAALKSLRFALLSSYRHVYLYDMN